MVKKTNQNKTHLHFGKFDFLQVVFSVNVDLSDVAAESQQGPNGRKGRFKLSQQNPLRSCETQLIRDKSIVGQSAAVGSQPCNSCAPL